MTANPPKHNGLFVRGEHGDKTEALKDEVHFFRPKIRNAVVAQATDVATGYDDLSARRCIDATDEIEKGGFAAPRWTHDHGEALRGDRKRNSPGRRGYARCRPGGSS